MWRDERAVSVEAWNQNGNQNCNHRLRVLSARFQHRCSFQHIFSTSSARFGRIFLQTRTKRARNAHKTRTRLAHDSHTTRTKRAQIGEGWIFRNLPRAIRDLTAQFCISWNISFLEFWIFTSSYRIACWSCRLNQEGCRWGQSAACLSLLDSR